MIADILDLVKNFSERQWYFETYANNIAFRAITPHKESDDEELPYSDQRQQHCSVDNIRKP
jgi:hypothetical protein